MNEPLNALLIVAVVVFVIARRFRARPVAEGRPFVLPGILAVVALMQGGAVDPAHEIIASLLLAVECAAAFGFGVLIGARMELWRAADGTAWSRGNKTVVALLLLSFATRAGLVAVGYAAGVEVSGGAIMLSVASWLVAQSLVVTRRAQRIPAEDLATL